MTKWTLAALIGILLATFTVGVPYALIPAFGFYFYALDQAPSMKARVIEALLFQWVTAFIVSGIIHADKSIWNGGLKIYLLLALVILPALMGYLFLHMLWRFALRNENVWFRLVGSAAAFTVLEQWVAYQNLSFGQFFAHEPLMTSWVSIFGSSILTFLTILCAELLALILIEIRSPKQDRNRRVGIWSAMLMGTLAIWTAPKWVHLFEQKSDGPSQVKPVSFAILQTNFDGATLIKEVAGDPQATDVVLGTFDKLISSIPEKPEVPQILVGGEVTFPALESPGLGGGALRGTDHLLSWLRNEKRLLIVGAAYFNSLGEHENVAVTAHVENGELKQRSFRKRIFLPFGETVGVFHHLTWFEKLIFQFPYAPAGTTPLFETFDRLPLGLGLCSEVFHRELFLELYQMGARVFVVSGNELSSYRTLGQGWLLSGLSLRAQEMGLPIIKTANFGGSAIIDGHGRILYQAPLGETIAHEQIVSVPLNLEPTFFVRHPDWLSNFLNAVFLISILVFGGRLGLATFERRKHRSAEPSRQSPEG